MTLLVCLNECSYRRDDVTPDEIGAALEQLVAVIRAVRTHRTDTALVAEAPFSRLMIGDGVAFARWQADGRNLELTRFLKSQLTRSPFSAVVEAGTEGSTDYHHNGAPARGLGIAHLVGGLAASLTLTPGWDEPFLQLRCETLVDDDVGDHREWLATSAGAAVHTGQALWQARQDLYPHLRFLPRVRDDLAAIQPVRVPAVKKLLTAFDRSVAEWDPARELAPRWPTKVTPEHQQRRALCYFDDPEGDGRTLFDTHARFTPWAGRMHFRWDPAAEKVVVAYLGDKLR